MRALAAILSVFLAGPAFAQGPRFVGPAGSCERAVDPSGAIGGLRLGAFGEVAAGGDVAFGEGRDFEEIRLDRSRAGACALFPAYGGVLVDVEAIRSADPESLFGIAGDSLVLRLRDAFGFVRLDPGYGTLVIEAGLIPDPWLRTLSEGYDVGAASTLLGERGRFFTASDLGAAALYTFLDDWARARVAITNGEGAAQIEQNRGKNLYLIAGADLARLDFAEATGTLAIHGGYRDGSLGAGSGRNHRIFGGLTFVHPQLYATIEHYEALGYGERPELHARGFGAAISATLLVPYLGLWARIDSLDPDVDTPDDGELSFEGGLHSDLFPGGPDASYRLRLYLGYRQNTLGDAAGPIPGTPAAAELRHVFLSLEASAFVGLSPKEE